MPDGEQELNEKPGGKKKGGLLTGKYKWWVVGGLGIIAVLVFFFVSKSKSNANAQTTGSGTTTMDPATQAALQSALQAQTAAGYSYNAATGAQGAPGPVGPVGPAGPTGPQGPAGTTSITSSPAPTGTTKTNAITTNPASSTYTVKAGDTLAGIAAKYGISVATLAHNNVYVKGEVAGDAKVGQPLGTGAGLKTGQVLTIPHVANA